MVLLYLPVILFVVIVPVVNEGVELPRSLVLANLLILYAIFRPDHLRAKNKFHYLPFILPLLYLISAIVNGQNILNALFVI